MLGIELPAILGSTFDSPYYEHIDCTFPCLYVGLTLGLSPRDTRQQCARLGSRVAAGLLHEPGILRLLKGTASTSLLETSRPFTGLRRPTCRNPRVIVADFYTSFNEASIGSRWRAYHSGLIETFNKRHHLYAPQEYFYDKFRGITPEMLISARAVVSASLFRTPGSARLDALTCRMSGTDLHPNGDLTRPHGCSHGSTKRLLSEF